MIVKELIEKLQELDPQTEVAGWNEWDDPEPLSKGRRVIHPLSAEDCVKYKLQFPAVNLLL